MRRHKETTRAAKLYSTRVKPSEPRARERRTLRIRLSAALAILACAGVAGSGKSGQMLGLSEVALQGRTEPVAARELLTGWHQDRAVPTCRAERPANLGDNVLNAALDPQARSGCESAWEGEIKQWRSEYDAPDGTPAGFATAQLGSAAQAARALEVAATAGRAQGWRGSLIRSGAPWARARELRWTVMDSGDITHHLTRRRGAWLIHLQIGPSPVQIRSPITSGEDPLNLDSSAERR